jgi:hypothetical protein
MTIDLNFDVMHKDCRTSAQRLADLDAMKAGLHCTKRTFTSNSISSSKRYSSIEDEAAYIEMLKRESN